MPDRRIPVGILSIPSAYRGTQSRRQLAYLKRLGDVVVGAGIQCQHLVIFAIHYCQHQDRQARHRAPDKAAGFYPAHSWHIHVQ